MKRFAGIGPILLLAAARAWSNDLYVGTSGGPFGEGAVYRYLGGTEWENISQGVRLGNTIRDLKMFEGELYAACQTSPGYGGGMGQGRVWRYGTDSTWELVGEFGTAATALLVMEGRLYATVMNWPGRHDFRRFEGETWKWTLMATAGGTGFGTGLVSSTRGREEIFLGEANRDAFWRYSSDSGLVLLDNWWRSCVFSMKEWDGAIYAGCWHGSFYRSVDGSHFTPQFYYKDHIWALERFQDRLYAGTGSTGGSAGRLTIWHEREHEMEEVHAWPVKRYAEGVCSLATDGDRLYIGLGMPNGYYSGDGTAEVWAYDGESFERLCPPDFFGAAVQSLLSTESATPMLRIDRTQVAPAVLRHGDSALVGVEATGIAVRTSKSSIRANLPRGWSLHTIDGPTRGRGLFAGAVTAPCAIRAGDYPIEIWLEGTTREGQPVLSSSVLLSIRVDPLSDDPGRRLAAETVLHLRALDANLDEPVLRDRYPTILDLSRYGIPLERVTRSFDASAGQVICSRYEYQRTGSLQEYAYATRSFWSYSTTIPSLVWSRGEVSMSWMGTTWHYGYKNESRVYLTYSPQTPVGTLAIDSQWLSTRVSHAWPPTTHYASVNGLDANPATSSAEQLFQDAGTGALASPVPLTLGGSITIDVTPALNFRRAGMALLRELSSTLKWSEAWNDPSGGSAVSEYEWQRVHFDPPSLRVTHLLGVGPSQLKTNAVRAILDGDASPYCNALAGVNKAYGRTARQWGFVHLPLVQARSDLSFEGDCFVGCDAQSDGAAMATGNSWIDGALLASDIAMRKGSASIADGFLSGVPPQFQEVDAVLADVGAVTVIRGNLKVSEKNPARGVLYVEGDVHVSGGRHNATIIATGDIHVSGPSRLQSAAGGWALYASSGRVHLSGPCEVIGHVAGGEVKIGGRVRVTEE